MPKAIFWIILLTTSAACLSSQPDALLVHIPTAEEESAYIWRTLQDLPFFEEHGYTLSLPQGELIDSLKKKSLAGELREADYQALEAFMRDGGYQRSAYEAGYQKIIARTALLNKLVAKWRGMETDWDMFAPPVHQITLTLYGPGGSYDPDDGSVLIYTTSDGRFKQYDDPANTLIHEIVHIGIEASLVQTYGMSHPLKERLVDLIVKTCFGGDLPDYRLQSFGDRSIDPFVNTVEDVRELDRIMKAYSTERD